MPEAIVYPESFKVLVRELNSLGLSIEAKGGTFIDGEEGELEGTVKDFAKALGAKDVATEELLNPKGNMEVEEVKEN